MKFRPLSLHSILCLAAAAACGPSAEQTPDAGGAPPAADGSSSSRPTPDADDGCPLAAGPPQKEAAFTRLDGLEDFTVEDRFVELIEGSVPQSRLRVALYQLNRPRVAEALAAAQARGVDVEVVLDENNQIEEPAGSGQWTWNEAVQLLLGELGPERVTICGGADQPPDGVGACIGHKNHHNKFAIFSELCDGSRNVVAQSSSNLTYEQLLVHSNVVIIRYDPGLFSAFESYFEDLVGQQQDRDYYRRADGDTGTRVFFYPRAPNGSSSIEANSDTIYRLLSGNVDCTGETRIRVAMSYWTEARLYLVDELEALQNSGCRVEVVVDSTGATEAIRDALRAALPAEQLRFLDNLQDKYFLIEGQYDGSQQQLVWTGSHNFTHSGLRRNDELLLRIDDAGIYGNYLEDWQALFASGTAAETP